MSHGSLLRHEDACAGALRALARDHRRAAAGRPAALSRSRRHASLCAGIATPRSRTPEAAERTQAVSGGLAACRRATVLQQHARNTSLWARRCWTGVEYHRGNHELGLRPSARGRHRDDNLEYIEPWAWMHPPRHALAASDGAGTLRGGRSRSTATTRPEREIQRCAQHPDNVWALHGLVECLQRRGERTERPLLEAKLAAALAKVDVPITSSCMCRTKVYLPKECCA